MADVPLFATQKPASITIVIAVSAFGGGRLDSGRLVCSSDVSLRRLPERPLLVLGG